MDAIVYQNLVQIAPGFVGIAASKLMSGDTKREELKNGILKYFLYTSAAHLTAYVIVKILLAAGCDISNSSKVNLAIVCAAIIGILWVPLIKRYAVKGANIINMKLGRNPIFLEDTLIEQVCRDNKPHYWAVFKDGKPMGMGWVEHINTNEKAICLNSVSGYSPESMEEKRTIVYLDKDIYIKEYIEK